MITTDGTGAVRVLNVADGKEVSNFGGPEAGAPRVISSSNNHLRFSPDGKSVLTSSMERPDPNAGYQRVLRVFDPATGKERCRLSGGERVSSIIYGAAFSPGTAATAAPIV